jgi:hypothetical protein
MWCSINTDSSFMSLSKPLPSYQPSFGPFPSCQPSFGPIPSCQPSFGPIQARSCASATLSLRHRAAILFCCRFVCWLLPLVRALATFVADSLGCAIARPLRQFVANYFGCRCNDLSRILLAALAAICHQFFWLRHRAPLATFCRRVYWLRHRAQILLAAPLSARRDDSYILLAAPLRAPRDDLSPFF